MRADLSKQSTSRGWASLSSKCTVDELYVALYFASLAAFILEMRLCKVQNHNCTGFEKNDD